MNATAAINLDENQPSRPWRSRQFSMADWIIAGTSLFIILNGLSVWVGWWVLSKPPKLATLRCVLAELTAAVPT